MTWLIEQLALTSPLEGLAVLLALVYLVLAAHQSQWCWLAAAIGCTIYAELMWSARLYMEAGLQVAYVLLAGYGWWQWQYGAGQQAAAQQQGFSWRWHVLMLLLMASISAIVALLLIRYTDAEAVWLDSFTTVFSLFATWLLTRKLFSNWLYWLVIDAVYVYLYASKGFVATGGLYAGYLLLVLYAMWQWQRQQQTERACCNSG
jgi:nicotinamide mononucleotide transporter